MRRRRSGLLLYVVDAAAIDRRGRRGGAGLPGALDPAVLPQGQRPARRRRAARGARLGSQRRLRRRVGQCARRGGRLEPDHVRGRRQDRCRAARRRRRGRGGHAAALGRRRVRGRADPPRRAPPAAPATRPAATSTCPCCSGSTPTSSPRPRPAWRSAWRPASSGSVPTDLEDLAAASMWSGGLRLLGIHVHMGSHLRDVSAWALAGCRAVRVLARVREVYPGAGHARRRRLRRRVPRPRHRPVTRRLRRGPRRGAGPGRAGAAADHGDRARPRGRRRRRVAGRRRAAHPSAWRRPAGGPGRRA